MRHYQQAQQAKFMHVRKSFSRLPLLFFCAVFLCHFIACMKRIPIPDYDQIAEESFLHVRLQNGDKLNVKDPKIEGKFLLGKTPVYNTRPGPYRDVEISLDEIENIQVEWFSLSKTIITVGAIGVTFATFAYFASQFELGFN